MGRFLLRLVTRRWGWTLIAGLVVISGSLWGVSSHMTSYQSSQNVSYYITATNNGDVYIWTSDNSTFYIARRNDFSPPIDRTQLHLDSNFAFVARTDTVSVNEQLVDNVHTTQAHVIEKLVVYNANNNVVATYKTADYQNNPNGYYDNHWWPIGSGIILFGLLMAYTALFVGRKKRTKPADPSTMPPGWPYTHIPPYPTTTPLQSQSGQLPPRP